MGEGPVVILCHGFPESWYSWRKQVGRTLLAPGEVAPVFGADLTVKE